MRIVGGKARGLKIKTIESDSTRPTKDMVREALFSIIAQDVPDSIFLDLFAGSGAVGIEALSRGAEYCYFADNNKECTKIITENLKKARFEQQATIYTLDYEKVINKIAEVKFDIIFLDPPYNIGLGLKAIKLISSFDLLKTNGIIIYETDGVEDIPEVIENYMKFKEKKYGRNVLNFYKRKE